MKAGQNHLVRWFKAWVNVLLTLTFLVLLIHLTLFSEQPLFIDEGIGVLQGQVPNLKYHGTSRFFWIIGLFFLFNLFFVLSLRQWARYYLNRKLFLSYVLALIPFLITGLIFAYGFRSWFGLSNTLNIEKTLEIAARDLDNFVARVESELYQTGMGFESKLPSMVRQSARSEFRDQKFFDTETLEVAIYFLSEKIPGQPRNLFPTYTQNRDGSARFIQEETEAFDAIFPTWIPSTRFTDIVSIDDQLYIQNFSMTEFDPGHFLIVAAIPIESSFLNELRAFQPAKISLANKEGTRFMQSDAADSPWYWDLILKPLSSRWNIQALNWRTGFYQHYGPMTFEIDPNEIMKTMTQDGLLHVFNREEKQLQMKLIIGFTLLLVIAELLALFFGLYLVHYITRSLNLIADGHERVAGGELHYKLPFLGKDQVGKMGRSFNSMVDNINSLLRQVREQEKFKEEIRIARDIQMSLLPDLEKLNWCDNISAVCIPAKEVGGDYYEVLQVAPKRTGIFIADVSGKGTSAALYMAEMKGALLALSRHWDYPQRLLLRLNQILSRTLKSNVFISAAYLLLDSETGTAKLARAGHCPSFLVRRNGEVRELLPPGMAIGIAKNQVFGRILDVEEFEMGPDDKVVLYTDGLDEMTFEDQLYGLDRLKAVLHEHASANVHDLKESVLKDVNRFMGCAEQHDDLTLVVAGLLGNGHPTD